MKFFLFISFLTAVLLGVTNELGWQHKSLPSRRTPGFLQNYQERVKDAFKRPENANMLFAFITGNKEGISAYTKKAFKRVNLSFLLSPSGIHLAGLLFFINLFLKKIKKKWLRHGARASALSALFCFSGFDSISRLIIIRLLFQFKFLTKLKITSEQIFIITFCLSFLLGQYQNSPLGFIFSFAFLGTFFSLRHFSKVTLILGLFSTQLILGLFLGEKVSLLSIPCGLMGSFIFTFLFPVFLIFLMSFWLIPINWVEPLIRIFILAVQWTSKCLSGSFTSSSLFLIFAMWVLMFQKTSKWKYGALFMLIFLHTNTAMTPIIQKGF
jgi:hypothetical protein